MANVASRNMAHRQTTRSGTGDFELEPFLPYRLNVVANLVSTALSRI
jgi:hypothetical protein